MNWFRTDCLRQSHTKFRRAVQAEPLSAPLWQNAGEMIAAGEGDGVVRSYLLADYAQKTAPNLVGAKLAKAVDALVVPVLWHPFDGDWSDCHCMGSQEEKNGRLPVLEPGDFLFHDWFDYQLPKRDGDDLAKQHDLRKRRLWADVELVTAIRNRDRDLCRYCAKPTRKVKGLTKSHDSLELDHVNWLGDNTFENVVVACRSCNRRKGNRTPEQWGTPLLPEPGPYGLEVVK